jgi:nitric-oxide synthase
MATCPITGARSSPEPDRPPSLSGILRFFRRSPSTTAPADTTRPSGAARLRAEAREYLDLLRSEKLLSSSEHAVRLAEIEASIAMTGTYRHTQLELEHGAKVAWRNASRCIGRLYWDNLQVRDLRHVETAQEMFDELVAHLRTATNGGRIRTTISVFAQRADGQSGPRIWNPQLIRYAGYRQPDGSIIGDPAQVEFTDRIKELGWQGGPGTPFDVLPLVIQMPGEDPQIFELPPDAVLEVPISHPEFPWFAELGIKWHALPVISSMRLDIGGIAYMAAPFNGWYMGTEIGARNLADADRYNLLPVVARGMGLDTSSNRSLWRDRALVELNVAVLHSYQQAGVAMIDHHTASRHFLRHEEQERDAGRLVPGDWTWLVPPISGSTSPLWPRPYKKVTLKPAFLMQKNPWDVAGAVAASKASPMPLDELTGLVRASMLEHHLALTAERGGAIAVVDLDEFAGLNADYGPVMGDAVLRAVGRAVRGVLRPEDTCVRLSGGDEMGVLLGSVPDARTAANIAQRVRAAVCAVYLPDAPSVTVRASVGVALLKRGSEPSLTLEAARGALRQAKATGRDRLVLADAAHFQRAA